MHFFTFLERKWHFVAHHCSLFKPHLVTLFEESQIAYGIFSILLSITALYSDLTLLLCLRNLTIAWDNKE